jgi:hypothetical protein
MDIRMNVQIKRWMDTQTERHIKKGVLIPFKNMKENTDSQTGRYTDSLMENVLIDGFKRQMDRQVDRWTDR